MANIRPRTHRANHNAETYSLRTCPTCDLQFWWPLKADPSVYAEEGYEAYADYHSGTRPFPRWAEPLFRSLPEKRGFALDIGCGDGAVLKRLSDSGYETYGIDLDEKSVRVAREKYHLDKVDAMTLEAFSQRCDGSSLYFNLITCFEVLEHQDAPLDFLATIRKLGYPGASLAGSVPNRNRFLSSLDRRLSDGDLPPHHFLWFSDKALTNLLQAAGFEKISIMRTGALSYQQITAKLTRAIARKIGTSTESRSWKKILISGIVPMLALVPWVGLRISPSHLYFQCRIPAGG